MKLENSAALFLSISIVVSRCSAILPGGESAPKGGAVGDEPKSTEEKNQNQTSSTPAVVKPDRPTKLDSNSTFYYEADTFLLNRGEPPSGRNSQGQEATTAATPVEWGPVGKGGRGGGRSGRMLDLDALVGDLEASRANRELRSQLTSRQSRNLNHQLELGGGGGKRLHIQGFIPIVGLKDSDEQQDDGVDKSASELNEMMAAASAGRQLAQRPRLKMMPTAGGSAGGPEQSPFMKQAASTAATLYESPFGQSSMGHATFNVRRLLSTDNQQVAAAAGAPVEMFAQNQQMVAAPSQPAAKYTAGLVETLKRPIQKLANTFGGSNNDNHQHKSISQQLQQQQNCLCVPNYMCKSGYLSESGLSRVQIQQMISQQQQQAARQSSGELVSGQPLGSLIDERSAEQGANPTTEAVAAPQAESSSLVAMNNLEASGHQESSSASGGDGDGEPSQSSAVDQPATPSADVKQPPESDGASLQGGGNFTTSLASFQPVDEMTTLNGANSDYTQDILGRMLGLKAANSRISLLGSASNTQAGAQHQASPAGNTCGILRTCCNIPVSFFGSLQSQKQQQPEPAGITAQQQVAALQRYQQPAVGSSQQTPAVRPLQLAYEQPPPGLQTSSLYHRSSPSTAPINNHLATLQYQQQQRRMSFAPSALASVQQFARAPPVQQPLQSFQAQQLRPPALVSSQSPARYSSQQLNQPPAIPLGSRKLLDGRCGLRQSAGVNGRVQNSPAGGENMADFGEYPAQAAILKRLNGSESLFVCSGTLISQSWVATAAHCIRKHMAPAGGQAQLQLRVRLGEWDVHRDDEFYGHVEKDVRDLVVHPDFIPGNLINDIALLRLESPIDSTLPHVMPACLPASDENFARQRCWVAGWGKDAFGQTGAFQSTLQEVELPVWGHAECEQSLRQTRLGPHYRLHPGFVCAGGELGKDACEGDGGSGLFCSQEGGVIKVAGLVSWGISCGQQNVPGVFVSIPHYRAWIENIIALDDDIYSPYNVLPLGGNGLVSERNAATEANNNSTSSLESRTSSSPQDGARNETGIVETKQ